MLLSNIRMLTASVRSRKADIYLGIILAFIAGAINAGGYLAVGQYTSHMTGIISSIADFIILNKLYAAFLSLVFLISFIIGAATSAFIINWARLKKIQSEFALPLLLEAILLILFGAIVTQTDYINITIILLCFIMGLQNAIITKISKSEIRTTHVTGMATDIGIELGKIIYKRSHINSEVTVNLARFKLFLSIISSFLLGGIIGAILFKDYGFLAILPFSSILLAITLPQILMDAKNLSITRSN